MPKSHLVHHWECLLDELDPLAHDTKQLAGGHQRRDALAGRGVDYASERRVEAASSIAAWRRLRSVATSSAWIWCVW